jgi:hypothetical protein
VDEAEAGDAPSRRSDGPSSDDGSAAGRSSTAVVLAIGAGAALIAATASAEPTGLRAADALWCAMAAVAVTWGAAWAGRLPLAWLGAVAAVVGVGGGWFPAACGLAALAATVVAASDRRPSNELAALGGALAVQALLRGPSYGFLALPTIVALAGAVPVVVSGWRGAPSSQHRIATKVALVIGAFVVLAGLTTAAAALAARSNLLDAASTARVALAEVRDGNLDQATAPLEASRDDFSSAAGVLGGPLTALGRVVPVVGQHVEALSRVASTGEELTATAAIASTSADYEALRTDNGSLDVEQIAQMAGPVRASADALVSAQQVVAEVRSPWLVDAVTVELDDLARELSDTAPAAIDAAEALEVAPRLLGADRPQRYLLMFATPGESRYAGGYIGTYGVLVADDGSLDLGTTGSTQELWPPGYEDPATAEFTYPYVPPPGWEQLYGRYHVELFPGNVSASPDWPTDSDVARQVYGNLPAVGETDGVLYADPVALAALLALTSPVEVPDVGYPLDETNVEDYLFLDQYVQFSEDRDERRDVLGLVTTAVFDALTTRPIPALGEVMDALGPVVAGGHLKFVSFDPAAEELFVRTGLAGAWTTSEGADWLSVRSANMLANKMDYFVRRSTVVDTVVDPATGAVESVVTVTLRNDSPSAGLPDYVIGNFDGYPTGTAKDALALYTPHGLVSATIDGTETAAERQAGYGGNIFTVPVVVAPGTTATVVYRIEGSVAAGPAYRLDVLAQPLTHDEDLLITLRAPDSTRPLTLFEGPLVEDVQLGAIGR